MTKVPLSGRELQCLGWVSQGKTSWETSIILSVSERTVNFHLRNACRKLEVFGRQAAVFKAMRLGMLDTLPTTTSLAPQGSPLVTSAPVIA